MESIAWLVIILPLLGFVINSFFGKKLTETTVSVIGSGVVLASFIISILLFSDFVTSGNTEPIRIIYLDWITVGAFSINYSVQLDQLSLMMMLIITGIGFLIHVYSHGYMHGDKGFARFFSYLNLFIFFMLILVMGSNYVLLFIGWEGVGLCSYLLIGFWYKNPAYSQAANKAFIMNRIGDLGLMLGIFLLFLGFSTLEYHHLNQIVISEYDAAQNGYIIQNATILLFIGAIGKSAQIPLFTWLPDAMAGPTPISALIHAATMVTAGVYLIIRSNVLFSLAPFTQEIIMVVSIATALVAALIGLKQNDIKKVLAYSTVSQLGYMFFALSIGAYTAAFFHLFTHAFFKALLFLGSGSVIHAMSGEQDIRRMGGLQKKLPITHITFLIGTLAIAGIPPLAGFFSKDQILASAFGHSPVLWAIMLFGALLTAFYMFRLYFLTFKGTFRGTEHQKEHLHESPLSMTLPLIILAIFSVGAGFINVPEVLGGGAWLDYFFEPLLSLSNGIVGEHAHLSHTIEWILMGSSVVAVSVIIAYAYYRYVSNNHLPAEDDEQESFLNTLFARKFYVDEVYETIIINPANKISLFLNRVVENRVIDGFVNGLAWTIQATSTVLRRVQTGNVGFYVFAFVVGVLLVLIFQIIRL